MTVPAEIAVAVINGLAALAVVIIGWWLPHNAKKSKHVAEEMAAAIAANGEQLQRMEKKVDAMNIRMDRISEIQEDHTNADIRIEKHQHRHDSEIAWLKKTHASKSDLELGIAQLGQQIQSSFEGAEASFSAVIRHAIESHVLDCPARAEHEQGKEK